MAGETRQGKFEERVRTAEAAVRGGNPTSDEMMWYERYLHSGSPEQATDMVTWDAWAEAGYPGSNTVSPTRTTGDYDPAANIADGTNIIADYDPFAVPDPNRDPTDFDADYGHGTEYVTMYDPFTGQNIQKAIDPNNPHMYTPGRGETINAYGPDGEPILLDVSQHGWENFGNKNFSGDQIDEGAWQLGYNPPDVAPPTQSWEEGLQGNLGTPNNPSDSIPYIPGTGPVDGGGGGGGGDDWFWTDPLDYTTAPQPDGDGEFVEGGPPADTSWDWNFFRDKAPGDRQWGGYDEDYQAFERYQPGMDSPWGMPNIEGGNEDFYQQQFVNQLRDEQGFRNRQRSSAMRAQEAADNPYEAPTSDEMWSWANGGQGLPEVKMGGEARTPSWDLIQGLNTDSTLGDTIRFFAGKEGFSGYESNMRKWLESGNESLDSNYWATRGDPSKIITQLGSQGDLTGKNRDWLTKMANSMYQEGAAGPYTPAGYASPIAWGGDYNTPAG